MFRMITIAAAAFALIAAGAAARSTGPHYLKVSDARDRTEMRALQQRTKTPGGPWRSTVGTCKRRSGTRVTCKYTLDHIAYTPALTMTVCNGRVAVHLRGSGKVTSRLTQEPCGPAR